ncbi:ATP-binding protein [Streptacidiphilus sp. PAMC 29251]
MALVERDRELSRVEELMAEARSGRGATVLVEGVPGIGKTALLAEVQARTAPLQITSLTARGGELERDLAFSIVRQLFDPPLRAAAPAVRADLLAGAAGLAAPVFLADRANEDLTTLGTVVHGLFWLCSNLADRTPLLLTVDDVHWADEASLRFLSHLARRLADLPVLLLLAGRPPVQGETGAAARALSGITPHLLRLGPLSADAVQVLVHESLSDEAEDAFCRACVRVSGGNPFLLAEALAGLRADGVRPVAAEVARVEALRPETISRSVLTRLARLGPEAVRLARAVAVLGPAAELRRAAALAGLDLLRAAELVDALAQETVISPGRPIEFVHPLVRTAVYADTSETLRRVAHKQVALMLHAEGAPPEGLAPHLLAAEPAADPWVVQALRAAATGALAQGAPEPAAACLQRALSEPPDPAVRGPILAVLGRALGMLSRTTEAADALRAALDLAEEPDTQVEIALELGVMMALLGRGREAVEAFARIREAIGSSNPELSRRVLAGTSCGALSVMAPPQAWMKELDRVAPEFESDGSSERLILAALAFGAASTGDRAAPVVARLAERAAAGPLPADPWLMVSFGSSALAVADLTPQALDLIDRGIDAARRRGDVSAFAYQSVLRSHTALYAGRVLEAEADGRAALEVYQGRPEDTALAAAVLIDALVERGDLSAAQEVLTDHGLEISQPLSGLISHFVHMARARLRLGQNRPREALTDLYSCGNDLVAAGYDNPAFAHWRAEAALAHHAINETATARALAAEELDLTRRFRAPRAIGVALRAAGLIEGGPAGVALLHEAVTVLGESPAELERARALTDYGALLRRTGRRTDAQEPLRRGLDLATRCGAAALAERASEELLATGARPRRTSLTGVESLTASELRVARLAADGRTNREVAQALFVTRRTVELHLTNVYRKLEINSRQLLSAKLEVADFGGTIG